MEALTAQDSLPLALKIIEEHAFSLLLETCLFTLYTVLIAYLAYRLFATRKTSPLPSFMIFYTGSMFALFSVYWILDVYFLWAEYRSVPSHRSGSLDGPRPGSVHWKGASWIHSDGLLPKYLAPVYVQYIVQLILIAFGDVVSLWRAYVVFGRPRWLYILSFSTAAAEGVVYALICASSSTQYLPSSDSASGFGNRLAEARTTLTFLGYAITGLTQVSSTMLIAYKAWVHWKAVREFMHRSATRLSFTALAIIIESGVVYLVLLTWYGSITYFGGASSLLVYTCRFYSAPLIAMYPTLVVVLVASRRSVLERSIVSVTLADGMPPRFGSSPVERQKCISRDRHSGCSSCPTVTSLAHRSSGDEDNRGWSKLQQLPA